VCCRVCVVLIGIDSLIGVVGKNHGVIKSMIIISGINLWLYIHQIRYIFQQQDSIGHVFDSRCALSKAYIAQW